MPSKEILDAKRAYSIQGTITQEILDRSVPCDQNWCMVSQYLRIMKGARNIQTKKETITFVMIDKDTGKEWFFMYMIPARLADAIRKFDDDRDSVKGPIKFRLQKGWMEPVKAKRYPAGKHVEFETTGKRKKAVPRSNGPRYHPRRRYSGNCYIVDPATSE